MARARGGGQNAPVPNYIALAVPFFFTFIGMEILVARRRRVDVYRFGDSVVDIGSGIFQQIGLVFFKFALFATYTFFWERFRLVDLSPKSPWTWVLGFLLVDFFYYWWHRLSHEVNFLWAAHVVHHSSEDYNLAVALRQSILTPWTIQPFHLPLAVAGVPPLVLLACESFNTLYQFWIHTQLVGKLGPLERVVNTPSLHRVHHAINPRYLDKNYGGTFMIWDRLFGTYEPETEPPVYGLVKPLQNFNPWWAQFHYWADLWKRAARTPRLADKARVFLKGPPYAPPGMEPFPPTPQVHPATFRKYEPEIPAAIKRYVFVHLVLVIAGATALMFFENDIALPGLAAGGALVYLSLLGWGGFFEGRRWAVPLELARLALIAVAAAAFTRSLPVAIAAALGAMAMAAWLLRTRPRPAMLAA